MAVAVAELVERRGCAPPAVAGQWLEAASHARTASQVARVDAALALQAARMGGPTALAALLDGTLGASADPRALCTVERLRGRYCRPA
jgi:hypothetical protein